MSKIPFGVERLRGGNMYFIYSGYVSSDNHDASEGPVYKLTTCATAEEVLKLKEEFESGLHSECSGAIFRVIEGTERKLEEEKKVVSWKLT